MTGANRRLYYSNKSIWEDEIIFGEARKMVLDVQEEEFLLPRSYLGADAVNYIVVDKDTSAVTVSTFKTMMGNHKSRGHGNITEGW
ncbi:hypothetical protein KHA80_21265 [Anaerobacillus sp. HL2]|nr:hypothetical protein KHA80_21265 [Anaerobacillus sp. HL2]